MWAAGTNWCFPLHSNISHVPQNRRHDKQIHIWTSMANGLIRILKLSLMDCQCFSNLSVPPYAKPSGLVSCHWATSVWCIPHQSPHYICHEQIFPFIVYFHMFRYDYMHEYKFLTQIMKLVSSWHLFSNFIRVIYYPLITKVSLII